MYVQELMYIHSYVQVYVYMYTFVHMRVYPLPDVLCTQTQWCACVHVYVLRYAQR